MNLRTLKKLSKRAAVLLPLLGDNRKQFPSERGDNYHDAFIGDRKHWERGRCHPTYQGRNGWGHPRGAEIVFVTRKGKHVVMRPPVHPRKGTAMVGATSGHYEPEWDEECAWIALDSIVRGHFLDFVRMMDDDYKGSVLTRDLSSPSKVLSAARDMIAELGRTA